MTGALAVLLLAGLVWLACRRFPWLDRTIGAAVTAYAAGIAAGLIAPELLHTRPAADVGEAAVALALPVFLFSTRFSLLRTMAGPVLTGMLLAAVSVFAVILALWTLRTGAWNAGKAAMMMGVYTGGTPNMAAISIALNLPENDFLTLATFDTFFSAFYLMLVMSVGRRFIGREASIGAPPGAAEEQSSPGTRIWVQTVLMAAALLALAVATGGAVPESIRGAVIISIVSCGGLAAAALKPGLFDTRVNEQLGTALMLIFCVSIGSRFDPQALSAENMATGWMVAGILFGALALHYLLCRLAGIPKAVFLITNVASICSPPFIPPVAASAGVPHLIPPGIAAGVLGYAAGTALGLAVYLLLS